MGGVGGQGRRLTSLMLLVGLLVIFAVIASPTHVGASSSPRPFKKDHLKYFVQLEGGAPDIATNFLPPLNTTFSGNFGMGILFAFNVTKEESRTSKLLGAVRGYTIDTNFVVGSTSPRSLEVELIQFDDGEFAGTLHAQGLVQAGPIEVALVGGTGSFRGARGYIIVKMVKMTPPNFITFSHDVHFL